MFRFDRLVLTVMLVGVAAVAWGAVKIPSFVIEASRISCDGTFRDITLNENADGMAILNYVSGADKTIVQVLFSDFTGDPKLNGLYFLRLSADDGSDDLDIGMVLVGSQGNGHFRGEVSGDRSGSSIEVLAEPGACGRVLIATGSPQPAGPWDLCVKWKIRPRAKRVARYFYRRAIGVLGGAQTIPSISA